MSALQKWVGCLAAGIGLRRDFHFPLVPNGEVVPAGGTGEWRSLGDSPHFMLEPAEAGFPSGWVLVKSSLRREPEGQILKLYYDTGSGISEQASVRLPVTRAGTVLELVRLPHGVRALRWAPMESKGEFVQGPVTMTEVRAPERIVRMLIRVWRIARLRPSGEARAYGLVWPRLLTDLAGANRIASALRDSVPDRLIGGAVDAGHADLRWGLDSPREWASPDEQVLVSGWCYSRKGPVGRIRAVRLPSMEEIAGTLGAPRPPSRHSDPVALDDDIGFSVTLPIERGFNQFLVEAECDGEWRSLCQATLFGLYRPLPHSFVSSFTYGEYIRAEAGVLPLAAEVAVAEASKNPHPPLISVVMPVFNTPPGVLTAAIDSVRRQLWQRWELIAVDDGSTSPAVLKLLRAAAVSDGRIRVIERKSNGGISAATNEGFSAARGEWVALLDHDDLLSPYALALFAKEITANPDVDLIYSDQDKIDKAGRRGTPFFKPDWSPLWFRGVMYLGHLLAFRRSLLDGGGCDSRFDGVQDFELALRLSARARRVIHVPHVLYHWRMIEGSIAEHGLAKPRIDELQAQAVQESLDRLGVAARAEATPPRHRVKIVPAGRGRYPLVSILIPTRDRPELISRCLGSLFALTRYPAFEVIVGDNETADADALRVMARHPVRRVPLPGAFHFSRFNNIMAAEAKGEMILLLNNDTEIVDPGWLDHLVLHAESRDAGAVGPLLTYADGTVQHAGVILGPRGTADHVLRGFPADGDGYYGSLACAREVSAVTGACLMVRAGLYRELGGLCERFMRHYEDVDFCLRLRARGLRNVFVAGTRLIHHESKSRGRLYDYTDRVLLLDRWGHAISKGDPYHSRHFGNDIAYRLSGKGLQA